MRKTDEKTTFFICGWDTMRLKRRDRQKAHVRSLLNLQFYILNFDFLAQFGGNLCEEKTQNIRKSA